MHGALHLPEIVLNVLHLVHVWDGNGPPDFTDIDNAGGVCRLWKELSLVVKWAHCPFDLLFRELAPFDLQKGVGAQSHQPVAWRL